jgi:hypothetical protein
LCCSTFDYVGFWRQRLTIPMAASTPAEAVVVTGGFSLQPMEASGGFPSGATLGRCG